MLSYIFIIILLISSSYEDYEKISKYSSVKVKPDTKVYLDISSYKEYELISLSFGMDVFFGSSSNKEVYSYYIGQVSSPYYYDTASWDNLSLVTNRNVSCSWGDYCTFKWDEIKQPGKNFIFIIPPTPFSDFYTFWGNYIKITHLGGLSAGEIAGIVCGCIAFIGGIIGIILCCRYCCRKTPYVPVSPVVAYVPPPVVTVMAPPPPPQQMTYYPTTY